MPFVRGVLLLFIYCVCVVLVVLIATSVLYAFHACLVAECFDVLLLGAL